MTLLDTAIVITGAAFLALLLIITIEWIVDRTNRRK